MDSGSIKSSGSLRPQDLGARRQVRKPATQNAAEASGAPTVQPQHARQRVVTDPDNLISFNGRTFDRAAPRGTYLNILV